MITKINNYRSFVDYAFKTCDSFSLVFHNSVYPLQMADFEILEHNISNQIRNKKSIFIHPDTNSHFEDSCLIYFRCNKFTKKIIKRTDDIFDWNGINLPEELCFYRNEKIWFLSIYHEKLLFIDKCTDEDMAFFTTHNILSF
jgi:hypothetical protein